MNAQIVFANGVTLWEINPDNNSLKNSYQDNLLSTAFLLFPLVTQVLGAERRISILRGFVSSSALYNEYGNVTTELQRHTRGLAIQFTWDGWTEDEAHRLAMELYSHALKESDMPFYVIYDIDDKSMYFGRGFPRKAKLMKKTINSTKVIREDSLHLVKAA